MENVKQPVSYEFHTTKNTCTFISRSEPAHSSLTGGPIYLSQESHLFQRCFLALDSLKWEEEEKDLYLWLLFSSSTSNMQPAKVLGGLLLHIFLASKVFLGFFHSTKTKLISNLVPHFLIQSAVALLLLPTIDCILRSNYLTNSLQASYSCHICM